MVGRDCSCLPEILDCVDWTGDALAAAHVENVGVDHFRFDILVALDFLDGSHAVPGHEQVSGEGVAKGVTAGPLRDTRISNRSLDGHLNDRLVEMVAADGIGPRIGPSGGGGVGDYGHGVKKT